MKNQNKTERLIEHLEEAIKHYKHLIDELYEGLKTGKGRPLRRYEKQLIWTSYMPYAEDLAGQLKLMIGTGQIEEADIIREEIQELLEFLKSI